MSVPASLVCIGLVLIFGTLIFCRLVAAIYLNWPRWVEVMAAVMAGTGGLCLAAGLIDLLLAAVR